VVADAVVFLSADAVNATKTKSQTGQNKFKTLEAMLKERKDQAPPRDMTMTLNERPEIRDVRIHIRGSVHTLGDTVPRGFLQVASCADDPRFPENQSGRRELADWIASPRNPLTARVYVNRVWNWLMGEGLVRTVDNFGTTGEKPSHPELLDNLTLEFIAGGWSTKRLIRQIVLSDVYQRGSETPNAPADPENLLLAHARRRRLEAEPIRDAILAVSGKLRLDVHGKTLPESLASDYGFSTEDSCRSVYLSVFRNAMPEILEVFDVANPSIVVGRRDVSTVSAQALYLLNHSAVINAAKDAAQRLSSFDPEATRDDRITDTSRRPRQFSAQPNSF
jgi:Protein of unknown function (DUF1553)